MFGRATTLFGLVLILPVTATAQPPRVPVAECNSPTAAIAARAPNAAAFLNVAEKAELFSGDRLVSLPGGTLTSKNGAVSVRVPGDFDARSPLPVLETIVSLNPPEKDVDLDFTFETGRVNVTNAKPDGAAVVRVRFADQNWKLTLETPKARVTLVLAGRWPAGSRFKPVDAKADPASLPAPLYSCILVVLSGTAAVDIGGVTVAMKAPPGPAELHWNSLAVGRPQPQKLEKLPEWADPDAKISDEGRRLAVAHERFRQGRALDPVRAFDPFLSALDLVDQRVGLINLGAFDDLDRLEKALAEAGTREKGDVAVSVLRHWLGRAQENDQRLYQHLTARSGYTDGHARVAVQLLLGFTQDDLAAPETYEVLIDHLAHRKPVIRALAAWHLVRVVPEGKSIALKAEPTEDDLRKYQAAWRALIPAGKLPVTAKKP